ncbi:MAG: ABC transporter permease [Thermomicrobiales bacterium]|nr:ABC transporter permease [Thermomicrobiales bacterium]
MTDRTSSINNDDGTVVGGSQPIVPVPGGAPLPTGPTLGDYSEAKSSAIHSPGSRTWRRFRRHKLAMAGAIVILLLVLTAILAPIIAPYDPNAINLMAINQPPSSDHWFGTDAVGRDTLSRAIFGARVSMTVGFFAVAIYLSIAFVLGATAAYVGGKVDTIIMRFTDIIMCFPTFVLTLILVGFLGPSIWNIVFVIGIFGWPGAARMIRSQVLTLRNQEYVQAAQSIGAGRWYILTKHIAPNTLGVMTVAGSLGIAGAILQEAGLSFLGLGVVAPTPSWGVMLNDARDPALLATFPWLWLVPGILISLAVISSNFIGDGLRDAYDVKGHGD